MDIIVNDAKPENSSSNPPKRPLSKTGFTNPRARSYSLTNMTTETNKTPTKPAKVMLSKCPCQKSNDSSWKLKCTGCGQIWHTICANLKTSRPIPESVILSLEKSWICPWCFKPPYLRPPGHPSCASENLLVGTVIADAVAEKVKEDVCNNILPEFQLSVDNLVKTRLREISKAVEGQVQSIKDGMKELTTLKEQMMATDLTHHPPNPPKPQHSNTSHALTNNPTNHIDDYRESFLTDEEITELNTGLGALSFSTVNGRGVASFGEEYHYHGAPNTNCNEIPNFLKAIIKKIHDDPEYTDEKINQVVINKYTGTTHLPEHSDDEPTIRPHSSIITVTLGQVVPVVFKDKISQEEETLEPVEGSLYAMKMESQHHWTHRINQVDLANNTRFSITFRSVGKNFRNSTIILGDSNTKHLKFSSGQRGEKGTFGYNMPGERVETFHINQIDERKCLGYRNIIIHCGVNDIRDNSPGRQPSDPQPTDTEAHFENLVGKMSIIKQMCPLSSITINPLLPTKNKRLNDRVLKFNDLLFNFLANDQRGEGIRSANLSMFVDEEHGVLREDYGVWDNRISAYSKRDILHLGKLGIRILAKVMRDSVHTKLVTSRSYSSTLSHQSRVQSWTTR